MFAADPFAVEIVIKILRHCVLVFLGLVLVTGCANVQVNSTSKTQEINKQISISAPSEIDQKGWWQVSFHRNYQDGDEPVWYLDTLLAYKIIKPAIEENPQISLWRFHRRAKADSVGRRFSFLFYSTRSDAEKIYHYVNEHALVRELLADKYLDRLSYYDINSKARSEIEATGDPSWPLELQKSWPYFIAGASQTWLHLIDEYYQQERPEEVLELTGQVALFKKLNDKINQVWEQKGHHAFLHHLNALFGYQELYILDRRLMHF